MSIFGFISLRDREPRNGALSVVGIRLGRVGLDDSERRLAEASKRSSKQRSQDRVRLYQRIVRTRAGAPQSSARPAMLGLMAPESGITWDEAERKITNKLLTNEHDFAGIVALLKRKNILEATA